MSLKDTVQKTKKNKHCVGIDYSLTNPAITIYRGGENWEPEHCRFFFLTDKSNRVKTDHPFYGDRMPKPETFENYQGRYHYISSWALRVLTGSESFPITIEGYSMGSKGKVFNIAENTEVLKYRLFQKNVICLEAPPTSVKKFATGNGQADKKRMTDAFIQDTGIDVHSLFGTGALKDISPVSDIADSYWLCKYQFSQIGF